MRELFLHPTLGFAAIGVALLAVAPAAVCLALAGLLGAFVLPVTPR